MTEFISEMKNENIDLRNIGVTGTKEEILNILKIVYRIQNANKEKTIVRLRFLLLQGKIESAHICLYFINLYFPFPREKIILSSVTVINEYRLLSDYYSTKMFVAKIG